MKSTAWVTSDCHFFHSNILKFNPRTRPYDSVDEMNEKLILDWNSKVAPFTDVVYILGDFCFGSVDKAVSILKRLNGRKILIQGNHDEKLVQDKRFRDEFEEIHLRLNLRYNDKFVVMHHFPIAEWERSHRGSYHLYGHLHGSKQHVQHMEQFRSTDVGVDSFCNGSAVAKLDDVLKFLEKREIMTHGDSSEV